MLHVTFTRVMGGYIKGTLLQCAIIGVGCVVLFGAIGIPNYAALGGIAGLLNIIPIVGPWLGGALAAIVGVFVSPWIAVIALGGTIAIQQIVYTFISPKIMANSVDVHPALTLIALMAGSAIGGAMSGFTGSLVGMLASIPAVAVAKSVFVYYFEKAHGAAAGKRRRRVLPRHHRLGRHARSHRRCHVAASQTSRRRSSASSSARPRPIRRRSIVRSVDRALLA